MAATPAHRPLEGETIETIAGREGRDPVDVMFDLAVDEKLGTTFNAALLNADEAAVEGLLRHDAGLISLSDAGAHLCYLCDAGYGLHLLGHWVRDKGVFDLADGIRRITSLPAQLYGIPDRGEIAPGKFRGPAALRPGGGRAGGAQAGRRPAGRREPPDPRALRGARGLGQRHRRVRRPGATATCPRRATCSTVSRAEGALSPCRPLPAGSSPLPLRLSMAETEQ